MAKIKCEITRYRVTSRETDTPNLIIQRRWLRSERIAGRYRDTPLRMELRDRAGRLMEAIPGALFRCVEDGEEFVVQEFSRSQRAVMIAA
jgi:hypothetical protein